MKFIGVAIHLQKCEEIRQFGVPHLPFEGPA